jgi:hypothetical protein
MQPVSILTRYGTALTGTATAITCILIGMTGSGAFARQVAPPAEAPVSDAPAAEPVAAEPVDLVDPLAIDGEIAADPVALGAAQMKLDAGVAAYGAGDNALARTQLVAAYGEAPAGIEGDKIAMEAARRLGFIALESRDPRNAESFFTAEALLGRRLFVRDNVPLRRYSDAIGRWASAAGALGRSDESAALVFYARELRRRQQAAVSSAILQRDATFDADTAAIGEVAVGDHCSAGRDALLSTRVSCQEEFATRQEALELQSRQIVADAPPPPTKEEREARAKERKAKGE